MANIAEIERKAVGMADGILAAVNENGNIDRFIDTKGGVHYIEPKRYEESVAKIDAAATKAKETVNSATEAVSECKAQTGACTQETARAKEIADTVESRITGIEGDVAALRDSVSQYTTKTFTSTAKVVKYGATTEIDTSVKIDGYTPVCITEVKSNHVGSCIVTQFGLRSDGTAFAGVQNNEVNNKGTWNDLKVTITVLYRKTV